MMIMVAYDGTVQARDTLKEGIGKARELNAGLIVANVFDTRMLLAYEATPGARDVARRESQRFMSEAETMVRERGAGLKASIVALEGDPEREVLTTAREAHADILLCPPKLSALIAQYRRALEQEGRTVIGADTSRLKPAAVSAAN